MTCVRYLSTLSTVLFMGLVPPPSLAFAQGVSIIMAPTPRVNEGFGRNLVTLDFNRDGVLDLAIGAPGEDVVHGVVGKVWIFYGPEFRSDEAHVLVSARSGPGDSFGLALATGDLNNDGWEELVVGAETGDVGEIPDAGYVSVWQWRLNAPWERCTLTALGPKRDTHFGASVAIAEVDPTSAGAEVLVGHSKNTVLPASWRSGSFHVFSCPTNQQATLLATVDNPNSTNNVGQFGAQMCIGDWDGDGNDDVYVTGIFNDASDGTRRWGFAGQVFVFAGPIVSGATPLVTIDNPTPWTDSLKGDCPYQRFGMYIDAADIDGDGFGELLVGAPRKDHINPSKLCNAGVGYLFSGSNFVPHTDSHIELYRPKPLVGDLMGYRVHFGDHIGDSQKDLVSCSLNPGTGSAYLWDGGSLPSGFGSAGTPTTVLAPLASSAAHWPDGTASAQLDGLGHEELIFGDRDYTPQGGPSSAGRVVIYFMP